MVIIIVHHQNMLKLFNITLVYVYTRCVKLFVHLILTNTIITFQKVEYYGRDALTSTYITTVIRSCSQGVCIPHIDNCTDKLLANPGCMLRHCCQDGNLCNGATRVQVGILTLLVVFLLNILDLTMLSRRTNHAILRSISCYITG